MPLSRLQGKQKPCCRPLRCQVQDDVEMGVFTIHSSMSSPFASSSTPSCDCDSLLDAGYIQSCSPPAADREYIPFPSPRSGWSSARTAVSDRVDALASTLLPRPRGGRYSRLGCGCPFRVEFRDITGCIYPIDTRASRRPLTNPVSNLGMVWMNWVTHCLSHTVHRCPSSASPSHL